jgi:glycosyltransferase involved in cell wall biosynthesis
MRNVSSPVISVVMPVRNGEPFLGEAIRSVLLQSFQDFELIMVDDHSAQPARAIMETFARLDRRIKLVKNEKRPGSAGARNTGIAHARGLYIAVHDADDVSRPERLQRQFEVLQKQSTLTILGTFLEMINAAGDLIKVHYEPVGSAILRFHLQVGTPIAHPTVMMRANSLRRMREIYRCHPAGDYHLWARMTLAGAQADNLPEPLVRYRIHPCQVSVVCSAEQAKIADRMARLSLARLTGRPPSEAHCTADFRQVTHSVLTGNSVACETTPQIVDDLAELILLCCRHGSLSQSESRSLGKRLDAFAAQRCIMRH